MKLGLSFYKEATKKLGLSFVLFFKEDRLKAIEHSQTASDFKLRCKVHAVHTHSKFSSLQTSKHITKKNKVTK